MKKTLLLFLCSLLGLLSYSATAQTYTPSFYLDLGSKSCYIQSLKVEKGWEITLHNFSKNEVHDTTFTLPIVTSDTLLKIINQCTGIDSSKKILTQKEKNPIDNILPVLFQSSAAGRLAGRFTVSDSIQSIIATEKRKFKIKRSKFSKDNLDTYLGPRKTDSLYNLQRRTGHRAELTLLGGISNASEKKDSVYMIQKKSIKHLNVDSLSFTMQSSKVNGSDVYTNKVIMDQPIGFISINFKAIPVGKKTDSVSISMYLKSAIIIDTVFKTKNSEPIILTKRKEADSLMILITPFIKKNQIDSITVFVKRIKIIHQDSLIYIYKQPEEPKEKYPDDFYVLMRKKSDNFKVARLADSYPDKNFGSTTLPGNYQVKNTYAIKRRFFSIIIHEKKEKYIALNVTKIEMDIKDGFIENLKVECDKNGKEILFKNKFPISISSKKSLDLFKKYYLYSIYSDATYKIPLHKLIQYNYETKANQLDVSPSDTCISYTLPAHSKGIINGEKEDQDKIFEYKIYTDVVGINDANPNGLVQIEGSKKINLWGRYYKFIGTKAAIGYFQHVEPSIKISKIENNNSYLIVNSDKTIDTTKKTIVAVNHITPLELLRYQRLCVSTNFNIFKFYNDHFKFKANIDVHFGYGQTKIRDSVYAIDSTNKTIIATQQAPKDDVANTLQMGIAGKINFFPDARWGFDFGIRYTNILLLDAHYTQTNVDTRTTYKQDTWINRAILSPEFELHKNYTNGSKFYVRYVFNAQVNRQWYNFVQFQIGYNAYLKF